MSVFYEPPPILTNRERQVLAYMLDGLARADIASVLMISPETVKIHTRNLLTKFGATNLRDGIRQMTAYQYMYGIGEGRENRFATRNILHVRVLSDQQWLHYHHKLTYLIIAGQYTGHRAIFENQAAVKDVEFSRVTIDRRKDMGQYTNYFVTCSPPIDQGKAVDIDMRCKQHITSGRAQGSDYHRNSVPTASKTLIYEFPENKISKIVSCQLSLGGIPLDSGAISTKQDGNRFTFHAEPLRLNSLFEVTWQW